MPRLVDQALDAIRDGDAEVTGDGIRLAASFFEQAHGQTRGLDREEVLAEPASPADLTRLRDALVTLVQSGVSAPVADGRVHQRLIERLRPRERRRQRLQLTYNDPQAARLAEKDLRAPPCPGI